MNDLLVFFIYLFIFLPLLCFCSSSTRALWPSRSLAFSLASSSAPWAGKNYTHKQIWRHLRVYLIKFTDRQQHLLLPALPCKFFFFSSSLPRSLVFRASTSSSLFLIRALSSASKLSPASSLDSNSIREKRKKEMYAMKQQSKACFRPNFRLVWSWEIRGLDQKST